MNGFFSRRRGFVLGLVAGGLTLPGGAQQTRHGRGYKPPPPTATVVVTVEKGFNEKPLANASVVFRAVRDDKVTANLETKTDPDGKASLDLLEIGSHITIQVIANGFATYATDFDLSDEGKQLLVKLQRPRAQISHYGDNQDAPAVTEPGVQERPNNKPGPPDPPVTPPPSETAPSPVPPASLPAPPTGSQR